MIATVSEKWTRYARVWLDGVDVTNECRMADESGVVEILKRGIDGKAIIENNKLAWEWKSGDVKIGIKDNAPDWAKTQYDAFRIKENK